MEATIDYIRTQLRRRAEEKQLPIIAKATGVSLRTLYYIANGRGAQGRTMRELDSYLKKNVRRRRLDEGQS
jgi:hypothetical protein